MGKRNNSQRKENAESPRKEISENEACNMTEKEFRVMVMEFIHRMDEKINNLCKNQEEMKSDIATIKNTMESFNSRLQEAEDRISELEDQVQKQAQYEQQLEKKIKKQEESLRELRDNMKRSNMRIIGLPEGQEEQQGLENLFEEIMTENFPDMGKIKVTQDNWPKDRCLKDSPHFTSHGIQSPSPQPYDTNINTGLSKQFSRQGTEDDGGVVYGPKEVVPNEFHSAWSNRASLVSITGNRLLTNMSFLMKLGPKGSQPGPRVPAAGQRREAAWVPGAGGKPNPKEEGAFSASTDDTHQPPRIRPHIPETFPRRQGKGGKPLRPSASILRPESNLLSPPGNATSELAVPFSGRRGT
ncbi:hypothetical protein QTO34_018492 [Cnephaeus nilssonii]|uniref:Uncharacterized protein n=1 Tax=Cnephaeus nilssonii TaxID=3371016 RepID=A0AA40LQ15_CNENI|nr:hypothetical protein QTO34_018492 [Eptesicus nilssonii]